MNNCHRRSNSNLFHDNYFNYFNQKCAIVVVVVDGVVVVAVVVAIVVLKFKVDAAQSESIPPQV